MLCQNVPEIMASTVTISIILGPVFIQSPEPINTSLFVHHVMIGRDRKEGWLLLDNQRNVSGQTVGGLVGLNVMSELYVGGYQEYNMAGLPEELTFTDSFQGLNN